MVVQGLQSADVCVLTNTGVTSLAQLRHYTLIASAKAI